MKPSDRQPFDVGSEKQLFIDDELIESSENINFVVHPPRKDERPCLVADKAWESMSISAYTNVLKEDGKYRLWYEAWDSSYKSDFDGRLCYTESEDGVNWEKPSLGLVEFQGNRDNNIVFHDRDGYGFHGHALFTDPSATEEERYKLLYMAKGGTRKDQWNTCMRGAYSSDGIRWHKYDGILADHLSDTQTVVRFDRETGKYIGYFRIWRPFGREGSWRGIGRSETGNFLKWPKNPAPVLGPDDDDPPDMDLYTNAYYQYPYATNAHFIFTACFYHEPDTLEIQLATSRDGINWRRDDRRAFVPLGPEGSWDDRCIYMGSGVLREGDGLWQYYTGYRNRHGESSPDRNRYRGALTRVVSRLDGFVSASCQYREGYLVTVPLVFSGRELELNCDAGAGGWVRAELLDKQGKPIPGYSLNDCDIIHWNNIARRITWQAKSDLVALAGQPVQIRLIMRSADLYAFQFV